LFFGCRNKNIDYIYSHELETAFEEGHLSLLVTAFSRDQEEKIYVQHRIREHAAFIWQAMESNGYIYVCGYDFVVLVLACLLACLLACVLVY
jgi:sulfite reductase alpha subunit-like flavoprotein